MKDLKILETLLRYELKKHSLITRDSSTVHSVKNIRVFKWSWYSTGKGLSLNYIRDSSGVLSISSHVKISTISMISSFSLKLYLNSLEHHRNIFGSSSKVFGNLRKFSEILGKCSGTFIWPSEQFWKIFRNLRKVVGNLRKIIKNAVVSTFIL